MTAASKKITITIDQKNNIEINLHDNGITYVGRAADFSMSFFSQFWQTGINAPPGVIHSTATNEAHATIEINAQKITTINKEINDDRTIKRD